MATTAATLEILVNARTAQATSSLRRLDTTAQKSEKHLGSLDTRTHRLGQTLGTAAKAALAAGAAYVGLQAAREAVTATTDLAKSTLTLKKGFGLTIATASELGAVLKARGADAASTGMAFNTLSRQVEAAKDGSATAASAFRDLGVSQKELKDSSPDQLLFQISDGMEKLGAGTKRTAATSVLFGRGWKTIGPILRDGSDTLQEQLDLANKYGAAFGGKSITSIRDLIATERELKIAQLGLQVQFTEKIAPALIKVGLAIAGAINWFEKLSPSIKLAAGAVALFSGAIYGAIKAVALFTAVSEVNPWILLATALAVAAILIVKHWDTIKKAVGDAFKFIKHHAILMGLALAPFTLGMSTLAAVVFKNWDKIKGAFQAGIHVIRVLKGVASDVFGAVKGTVVGAGKAIISVLAKIVRVVGSVISAFNDIKSAPGDILKGAEDKLNPANLFNGLQTGGVIVSGTGSGDKVPAMLEPGEVVLNRNAVQHLGGAGKANSLNAMIPRFAGGGVVGGGVMQAGKGGISVAATAAVQLIKLLAKKAGTGSVAGLLKEAERMSSLKQPYLWGGGHSGFSHNGPWDCSGAVSQVLHGAGLPISAPMVSGGFMSYGLPGLGQGGKTGIFANGEHVFMSIDGKGYGTSAENPGGGFGGPLSYNSRTGFVQRHPDLAAAMAHSGPNNKKGQPLKKGFQKGGVVKISPHSPSRPAVGDQWIKNVGGHWDPDEIFTALRQLGAPKDMAGFLSAVSVGESGGNPRAIGHDPGGSTGLGLLQMTIGVGNDSLINRFGGRSGMLNPWENMLAAMELYRSSGPGAWFGHQGSRGHLLLDRITGATKAGKTKTPKAGKTTAPPDIFASGDVPFQDFTDVVSSVNDLIGEGNLEALQRYQTGVAQNPILGIPSPGMPHLDPYKTTADYAQRPSGGGRTVGLGEAYATAAAGSPAVHHHHIYIDGKELKGGIQKVTRTQSRRGRRPLPSSRH